MSPTEKKLYKADIRGVHLTKKKAYRIIRYDCTVKLNHWASKEKINASVNI